MIGDRQAHTGGSGRSQPTALLGATGPHDAPHQRHDVHHSPALHNAEPTGGLQDRVARQHASKQEIAELSASHATSWVEGWSQLPPHDRTINRVNCLMPL